MNIAKREDELKERLFAVARKLPSTYFLLPIQDVRKSGTPDFSLHGYQKSSWWEVKHATPVRNREPQVGIAVFDSPGIQEIICQRLARTSYCRYIVYIDMWMSYPDAPMKRVQLTTIIKPIFVANHDGKLDWASVLDVADVVFEGHNHDAVVKHMAEQHLVERAA